MPVPRGSQVLQPVVELAIESKSSHSGLREYQPGKDSCYASRSECVESRIIHKDGGGEGSKEAFPTVKTQEFWERNIPWSYRDVKSPPSYSERRRMRYSLQDYMQEAIGFTNYRSKRVLEVGCGAGIDTAEFARNGAMVTAIDSSQLAVDETKKTLREARVAGKVLKAPAESIPFPDNSFDLVYSFGVLHHVSEIGESLREITRVLVPSGEFVGMFYNRNSLLYAYSILFLHKDEGRTEEELLRKYAERVKGAPLVRVFSIDSLRTLLSEYFDVRSIKAYYDVIDTPDERKVKLRVPRDLGLGWHLLARARKQS